MTREQLDEIASGWAYSSSATALHIHKLIAQAREALGLREALSKATRFLIQRPQYSAVGWIEVCRCEGHRLPKQPYMWAVRRDGHVLGKQWQWEHEPLPSSRDDEFYAEYRFDTREEAEKAALEAINNARRGK